MKFITNFDETCAARVKDIEKTTNHDVNIVEYFIKEEFDKIEDWFLQGIYTFWINFSGYKQY